eukprot:518578-Amorphochlora_amoeboformis.AAC.2
MASEASTASRAVTISNDSKRSREIHTSLATKFKLRSFNGNYPGCFPVIPDIPAILGIISRNPSNPRESRVSQILMKWRRTLALGEHTVGYIACFACSITYVTLAGFLTWLINV